MPTPNARMDIDQDGLDFITKWEGIKLYVYKDVTLRKHYGVGHLVRADEDAQFPMGKKITREFAMETLTKDVRSVVSAIRKYVTVKLNQNQFNALVSFGFNVGTGPFSNGSSLLDAVNAKEFSRVPALLGEWRNITVNGVRQVNEGLVQRRKDEADLFMRPSAASQSSQAGSRTEAQPSSSWNSNHLAMILMAIASATMAHHMGLLDKIRSFTRASTRKRTNAPQLTP